MSKNRLNAMLEKAVRLGSTSAGAQALTDYKLALWKFNGNSWKA